MTTKTTTASTSTIDLTSAQQALLASLTATPRRIDGRAARAAKALDKLGLAKLVVSDDGGELPAYMISLPIVVKAEPVKAPKAKALSPMNKRLAKMSDEFAAKSKPAAKAKPAKKAAKAKKVNNAWSLVTKREIADRLAESDDYLCEAITLLQARTSERKAGMVAHGFMSSHAVPAARFAEAIKKSGRLDKADVAAARSIARCYVKQLALVERSQQIASDKSGRLASLARVYGLEVQA